MLLQYNYCKPERHVFQEFGLSGKVFNPYKSIFAKDIKWGYGTHPAIALQRLPPKYSQPQTHDLVCSCVKLTNMMTSEKNRGSNCLALPNLKTDDVFSDVFGK